MPREDGTEVLVGRVAVSKTVRRLLRHGETALEYLWVGSRDKSVDRRWSRHA
ncbi:MAG: hypothetical protein PUH82_02930 [Bacteroidales bacterium]|nr:hypothetical protein [Bacteroidales bacterium]